MIWSKTRCRLLALTLHLLHLFHLSSQSTILRLALARAAGHWSSEALTAENSGWSRLRADAPWSKWSKECAVEVISSLILLCLQHEVILHVVHWVFHKESNLEFYNCCLVHSAFLMTGPNSRLSEWWDDALMSCIDRWLQLASTTMLNYALIQRTDQHCSCCKNTTVGPSSWRHQASFASFDTFCTLCTFISVCPCWLAWRV